APSTCVAFTSAFARSSLRTAAASPFMAASAMSLPAPRTDAAAHSSATATHTAARRIIDRSLSLEGEDLTFQMQPRKHEDTKKNFSFSCLRVVAVAFQ